MVKVGINTIGAGIQRMYSLYSRFAFFVLFAIVFFAFVPGIRDIIICMHFLRVFVFLFLTKNRQRVGPHYAQETMPVDSLGVKQSVFRGSVTQSRSIAR